MLLFKTILVCLCAAGIAAAAGTVGAVQAEAEAARQQVAAAETGFGPNHPVTAILLSNLAAVYCKEELYGKSEGLYKRSLTILENAVGPNDPALAPSLTGLGELYFLQGRYTEAERALKHAVEIAPPESVAYLATALNDLGAVYHAQGDYDKAEPLYQRALALRQKFFGPDHPHTLVVAKNLSTLIEARMAHSARKQKREQRTYRNCLSAGDPVSPAER